MPTESHHLALHPGGHICAHCENHDYVVTPENGFSVRYPVGVNVDIEVFLHHCCAEDWAREFNVEIPPHVKGAGND